METNEEKDTAPLIEDKPQPTIFNQDARDAVEAAFDAFKAEAEGREQTPPAAEPAALAQAADKPQEDKGFDVASSQTVDGQQTSITEEWKPEFKDHKTAEESYRHARQKMQQATEEAARLRREREDLEARLEAMRQSPSPMQQPGQDQQQAPPMMDKETLEAEFFKDPIGFQLAMNEAAARHAIEQAEAKISEKTKAERMVMMQKSMSSKLQEHFDTSYPELKKVEPLATDYTERVRQDREFMEPLFRQIKEAPNELKARKIFEVSKAVMDEGVKRLRNDLPVIGEALGFAPVAGQPIKERLKSGSPSIVPGGSSGPTVKPSGNYEPESPEAYMRDRIKRQEKMMAHRFHR